MDSLFLRPDQLDLGHQRSHLCIERVKIFGDGSLGAETAAISVLEEEEEEEEGQGGGRGETSSKTRMTDKSTIKTSAHASQQTLVSSSSLCTEPTTTLDSVTGSGDGDGAGSRIVKISFPAAVGREIDYAFQDSLQQYLQQYGAVSQVSFHTVPPSSLGDDESHLAEVLFQVLKCLITDHSAAIRFHHNKYCFY
jgi:hypothetical protein